MHAFWLKQWKDKERNHVYTFVYLTYIQLPWVFLGNGNVVLIVLQSRINCGFRMVIRELKAAHAQQREEKAWKQHLHAHLHPSSTELLSQTTVQDTCLLSWCTRWRSKCAWMCVPAGVAHTDFDPTTSCFSVTTASTTACAALTWARWANQ